MAVTCRLRRRGPRADKVVADPAGGEGKVLRGGGLPDKHHAAAPVGGEQGAA